MSMQKASVRDLAVPSSIREPRQAALAQNEDFMPVVENISQMLLRKFLTMGTRDRFWLILSFTAFVGTYLIWPILFSLRIDGDISMTWTTVWIPMWVTDALAVLFLLLLVSRGPIRAPPGMEEGWCDPYPMERRVLALVKMLLATLFQVFLVFRLDGYIDWSWWKVLSPLMSLLGVDILANLYSLYNQTQRLILWRVIAGGRLVLEDADLMIQLVILVLKLEGEVNWNWWVVFIPVWLYYVCSLFGAILNYAMGIYLTKDLEMDNLSEEETKRFLEASLLLGSANSQTGLSCCSIIMIILAVNLIDGADYSTLVVFIPLFLSTGALVCWASCAICLFRATSEVEVDVIAGPAGGGQV